MSVFNFEKKKEKKRNTNKKQKIEGITEKKQRRVKIAQLKSNIGLLVDDLTLF